MLTLDSTIKSQIAQSTWNLQSQDIACKMFTKKEIIIKYGRIGHAEREREREIERER
jgi:hypothetical protein